MEKVILKLTERLIQEAKNATAQEQDAHRVRCENGVLRNKLEEAEAKIAKLEKEVESNTSTINYWADKAVKYENELAELKEAADDET